MPIKQLVHWFHTIFAIIFIHLGSCATPSLIPEVINDNHRTNWTNTISCPKQCFCSLQLSIYSGELVQAVNCSFQSITSVPKSIPTDTESLGLTYNLIEDLYDQLPAFDRLQELYLSHNQINHLGRGQTFANLTHLKLLDISHNKFRTLFADVFRGLKRLEILDLSNGHIKYIDEHAFDGLDMLKELNIENNQLSSIYLELFQSILNLSVLNVGGNSISHLTGGIFASLTGLRKLVFSRNRIISINDNAFVGLELLEELYLNDNHLIRVPSTALQSLKRLITINIDTNPLEQLSTGDFVHIPVNHISVANCKQLVLIDKGAFWDLPNINNIILHSNPNLQYIDSQAFLGLPLLHSLQLHDCGLKTFQHDIIDYVFNDQQFHPKHKLKVTFDGNPILCDCNIQYLYQCLKHPNSSKIELIDGKNLQCFQPKSLSEIKLIELTDNLIPQECTPKIVTIGKANVTIHKKIGDRHVFQCKALGLPVPKIIWVLPNGDVLNETSNQIHIQLKTPGSLRIFHLRPKDSGVYKCIAENRHGIALSSMELLVNDIDLHLFAINVASTYVTLVWNGTARNLFPEYQILYHRIDSNNLSTNITKYETVTVNHYLRSYTINNLMPNHKYKMCISIRDDDNDISGSVQLSCTIVQTAPAYMVGSMTGHVSNMAVALTLSVFVLMIFVICFSLCAARQYHKKFQYETSHKSLIDNMIIIPMDNICSPLITTTSNNGTDNSTANCGANDTNEVINDNNTIVAVNEHNI
ncbi:leucine-rich repeat neuronal protein 1-like [Oppia nitens]|uniref:leucine-rich repeat neuronal protein 1-like n=1 Tax=Oppia nitens TaxID=1686743 RepID=UPI0023DC434F|nr:leucine-rich repeat neuronal protein 1-like [Oppia nitens]